MGEVWKEITQGITVKILVITLLSISLFFFLCSLFFYSLKENPPETNKSAKKNHIEAQNMITTLNQTNFTQ